MTHQPSPKPGKQEAKPFTGEIDGGGVKVALTVPKLRLDLVPPQTVQAIAEVLGFGAAKYCAHNWMRGIAFSQLAAGVKRHIASFEMGEETDPESGLPHLAHALCGLTFLHYHAHGPRNSEYRSSQDDRVFKERDAGGKAA
jgi:hypothetical protein